MDSRYVSRSAARWCARLLLVWFCAQRLTAQEDDARQYPPPPPDADWGAIGKVFSAFPDINREAVLGMIREEFPDEWQEFQRVSVRHLSRAVERMKATVEDAVDLLEARQRDPALYRKLLDKRMLERKTLALARLCRAQTGPDQEQKVAELREMLGQIFTMKQEFMKADVARIEKGLNELKALVAKREARRAGLIEDRLRELVGAGTNVKW